MADEAGVSEYSLARFAAFEGKLGGQFYTTQCVVRTLVEMLEPYSSGVRLLRGSTCRRKRHQIVYYLLIHSITVSL